MPDRASAGDLVVVVDLDGFDRTLLVSAPRRLLGPNAAEVDRSGYHAIASDLLSDCSGNQDDRAPSPMWLLGSVVGSMGPTTDRYSERVHLATSPAYPFWQQQPTPPFLVDLWMRDIDDPLSLDVLDRDVAAYDPRTYLAGNDDTIAIGMEMPGRHAIDIVLQDALTGARGDVTTVVIEIPPPDREGWCGCSSTSRSDSGAIALAVACVALALRRRAMRQELVG